jgi:hypothetical protein
MEGAGCGFHAGPASARASPQSWRAQVPRSRPRVSSSSRAYSGDRSSGTHSSPAFIRIGRLDILAVNRLGRRLYAPLFADHGAQTVDIARLQLLNPAGRDSFPDWEESLNATVSLLRTETGRAPGDTDLTGLIGELVTRSEEFHTAWAKHNVRLHHTGPQNRPPPGHWRDRPRLRRDGTALAAGPDLDRLLPPSPPPRPTTRCACWPRGRPPKTRPLPPTAAEQRPRPRAFVRCHRTRSITMHTRTLGQGP